MSKPVTAAKLNEGVAKLFGEKINLASFTMEQLQDTRNKLRTKLSQVETTESFNSVQKNSYQKTKLFADVINAELAEREHIRESLKEGKEDQAELIMAAKDMVDRLTGWMEDTSEMQTSSMLELADAIRDDLGSEISEQFVTSIKPSLEQLYASMEQTRTTLTNGVGLLTGETDPSVPMGDMSDELGMDGMDDETDITGGDDLDLDGPEDDFETDPSAAGGELDAGRAKRESVDRSRRLGKMFATEGKGKKPDFLDVDKDGNKKEPMKKAAANKKSTPKKK